MEAVRDGEVRLLGELYTRHHRALFGYFIRLCANPDLAGDLVQEVFLRILKYRGTYRGTGTFTGWLYRLARNVFHDQLRRRRPDVPLDGIPEMRLAESPRVIEGLDTDRRLATFRDAFHRLPPEKREILALSHFQHLRYAEIGRLLGCTEGAVKVRVHRAVKQLRDLVQKESEHVARTS